MANIATKEGLNTVRHLLKSNQAKLASALGANITPEYFSRVFLTSVERTPKLLQCSQNSLLGSLMDIAQLRLTPDGILGHAYLVPYKTTAVCIIGYKGLRELVLRTGKYRDLRSRVVYEKDKFSYSYGMNEKLEHIPADGDRGEPVAVWAIAEHMDGGTNIEVMTAHAVIKHRNQYAPGWRKDDSAWQTNPDSMWEKTSIRKLCKRLSMSVEVQKILAKEERMEAGLDVETGEVIDIEPNTDGGADPDKKPEGDGVDDLVKDLEKTPNNAEPLPPDVLESMRAECQKELDKWPKKDQPEALKIALQRSGCENPTILKGAKALSEVPDSLIEGLINYYDSLKGDSAK